MFILWLGGFKKTKKWCREAENGSASRVGSDDQTDGSLRIAVREVEGPF
jgi:hypothetical protein